MAVEIIKEPANPLFSKNEIAWKVRTTLSDLEIRLVGHLFIELVPYSNQWDFVKRIEAFPDPQDSNSAWFFVQDALDRYLHYFGKPSADGLPYIDEDVCRRIRFEFYEYKRSDLVLKETLYNGGTTNRTVLISFDASASQRYLFRTYYQRSDNKGISLGQGISISYVDVDAWTFSSDFGMYYDTTMNPALFDRVHTIPPGASVEIYEWERPTTVLSSIRFVLKGGIDIRRYGQITQDPDYWVDENLDNVIDQDGNLILAP